MGTQTQFVPLRNHILSQVRKQQVIAGRAGTRSLVPSKFRILSPPGREELPWLLPLPWEVQEFHISGWNFLPSTSEDTWAQVSPHSCSTKGLGFV